MNAKKTVLILAVALSACAQPHPPAGPAPDRGDVCHEEPLSLEERTDRGVERVIDGIISVGILAGAFFAGMAVD